MSTVSIEAKPLRGCGNKRAGTHVCCLLSTSGRSFKHQRVLRMKMRCRSLTIPAQASRKADAFQSIREEEEEQEAGASKNGKVSTAALTRRGYSGRPLLSRSESLGGRYPLF